MTVDEATKILTVVCAAYPSHFKDMSAEMAKGTVTVWAVQFAEVPADIVFMAVNKHISVSKFPPTVSEIKEKISSLYWDSYTALHTGLKPTGKLLEEYQRIYDITKKFKYKEHEPALSTMIDSSQIYLLE